MSFEFSTGSLNYNFETFSSIMLVKKQYTKKRMNRYYFYWFFNYQEQQLTTIKKIIIFLFLTFILLRLEDSFKLLLFLNIICY